MVLKLVDVVSREEERQGERADCWLMHQSGTVWRLLGFGVEF